jgi:hypothetical protein
VPLTTREIADIEKSHPDGLSSKQIMELMAHSGQPMTEATLRKYVQLGLLPRSRRVGEKGKHRGSKGIYPWLAKASQAVRGKLASVRVAVGEVLTAAQTDVTTRDLDRAHRTELKAELARLTKQAKDWLRDMEKWTAEISADAEGRAKRSRRAGGV